MKLLTLSTLGLKLIFSVRGQLSNDPEVVDPCPDGFDHVEGVIKAAGKKVENYSLKHLFKEDGREVMSVGCRAPSWQDNNNVTHPYEDEPWDSEESKQYAKFKDDRAARLKWMVAHGGIPKDYPKKGYQGIFYCFPKQSATWNENEAIPLDCPTYNQVGAWKNFAEPPVSVVPWVVNRSDQIIGLNDEMTWNTMSGRLADISCTPWSGNVVCWGANSQGHVYAGRTNTVTVNEKGITSIPWSLKKRGKSIKAISVSEKDGSVWMVNKRGAISRSKGNWFSMKSVYGGLSDVAALEYGQAWGVNAGGQTWFFHNNKWNRDTRAGFFARKIAVCRNGWILLVDRNGNIWKKGHFWTGWVKIDGRATDVACHKNVPYVIGAQGVVYVGTNSINWSKGWRQISGSMGAKRIG